MNGRKNIGIRLAVCMLVPALSVAVPAVGGTHYVSPGQSIQAAIDASSNGDEIEVAPGTYGEAINFNGKAIRLYSTAGPNDTTIDGSGHYHIVQCISSEEPNTILEGFTITGGNANGTDPNDRRGGGMFNFNSSPTVTNCTFSGNSAITDGGGMYNDWDSYPTLANCILWADKPNEIYDGGTSGTSVTYSDVQGGTDQSWFGNGCIDAETVHAHAHLRAMKGIKSTNENLQAAIDGEGHEFKQMYPGFVAEAEKEGNKPAFYSFQNALAVEEIHHGLYSEALESVKSGSDLPKTTIFVCQVCGNTVRGEAPDKCPVCGAAKGKFNEIA